MALANREQSEFNLAINWLNQLNACIFLANEGAMEMDAFKWLNALLSMERLLIPQMEKEEIESFENRRAQLQNELEIFVLNKNRKGVTGLKRSFYDGLHKYQCDLMTVLKKSGLLTRFKDNIEMEFT